jgi:predicted porin
MKKMILLLTAAILAVSVNAQDFSWGLKGGLNIATLSNYHAADMKFSAYAGGFVEYKFNNFFGLAPELVYSRQGTKSVENFSGVITTTRVRLNYINLPIMAKLYVVDNLSLDFGPQFGLLTEAKANVKTKATAGSPKTNATTSIKGNFKTADVGLGMGLTYNIGGVFLQARYNLGLTKVFKMTESKSKNNVIQIGMGYRF